MTEIYLKYFHKQQQKERFRNEFQNRDGTLTLES